MAERIVVLGGIRSGKSALAEQIVATSPTVTYVATGTASDAEMAARIAAHRGRRPATWQTVETTDLAGALRAAQPGGVLIDALGGWLTARMSDFDLWPDPQTPTAPLDHQAAARAEALLTELDALWGVADEHAGGPVVVVVEDVTGGLVPADPVARRWVDLAGAAAQRLAEPAERVLLAVAGRAVALPPAAALFTGAAGPPASGTAVPEPSAASDRGRTPDLRAHGDAMVPAGTLDLAVNVVTGGPSPAVRAALATAADYVASYPDDTAARRAIADRHGRSIDEVLPTAGAADALWTVAYALRPRRAAIITPQFTEPEAAVRAVGGQVQHIARDPDAAWRFDPTEVAPDADLVTVGNPTNPTGHLDDPDDIAALCRPGRVTLVDEAFMDFVTDDVRWTLTSRRDLAGLVVVRSPTKLWGLPGVRAGYLLGESTVVSTLVSARRPWAVGTVGLAALAATAADTEHRHTVATATAHARHDLLERLANVANVHAVAEPAANFVLVSVPHGPVIHQRLLDHDIAVRPATFPGLSTDHLRITVRDALAHQRLADTLATVLAAAGPQPQR